MSTTYGTIPTSNPPYFPTTTTTTTNEFLTRATDHLRTNLSTRRPWSELLPITLPHSLNAALTRIKTNTPYFRTNYVIITLITLFLSLLYHPISLIVFSFMIAAWLYLYFLRDTPLVVARYTVDDNVVLLVLSVLTVGFLLFTDVTVNIVVGVLVGVGVCLLHAALRSSDDLRVGGGEFEDGRVGFGERLPLNDAASSAYSS